MAKRATNPGKSVGITGGQIKKIHALTGAMKLDDGVYRAVLSTRFRVESSKDLKYFQAENLIQDLEAKAISAGVWEKRTDSKKFEEWGRRQGGMASAPQLRKIEAIWKDVSRAETTEERKKGLRSFLERIAKVSDLRFLDMDGAGKVINALTSMQKKAMCQESGGAVPRRELTTQEVVLNRAKRIVKGLAGLKDGDALWILYTSINIIAMRSGGPASPGIIQNVNINLRPRKRGFPPILDKNSELRAYIHGLDRYLTIKELHAELVAKFGASRVPGEETIRRYLKRLAQSKP